MKRKSLEPGALTAPIPPAMVTVGNMDSSNVLTVAWTGILATVPPKTYISVRPSRHSFAMLEENPEFVINLPTVSLARTVDYVGIYTGKKVDKFEKCSLNKVPSEKVAPPTIAECPIALECKVSDVLPMGSHHVFIADIVSVSVNKELLDEKGKIRFDRADLLAYAHGEYYSLGDIVGKFGFSTDKSKAPIGTRKSSAPKKQSKTAAGEEKTPREKNGGDENKRPFYLDLPESVRKKNGAKKGKRK